MMRLGLVCMVLLAAAGCVSGRMEMGVEPRVERLERDLQIGKSTAADVRRVLGEPDGRGQSSLGIHEGPRTVWSYYYEFSDFSGSQVERWGRTFLWVYLDGEVYDGYLWFSSLPDRK
jgi:hypothetical protein